MDHVLQSLENSIILDDETVISIRQDIRKNYPTADTEFRARLLSESIHEVIDTQLPGISAPSKMEIRLSLLRDSISRNTMMISQKDVIEHVMRIEAPLCEKSEYITNLIGAYTGDTIADSDVDYILDLLKPQKDEALFQGEKKGVSKLVPMSPLRAFSAANGETSVWSASLLGPIIVVLAAFLVSFYALGEASPSSKGIDYSKSMSFADGSAFILQGSAYSDQFRTTAQEILTADQPGIPEFLEYKDISYKGISLYLESRNSSLTQGEYLQILDKVAGEYNVHPLLLLAIVGQEQGFVPKDSPYAERILNNPFNVYSSWTKYNTDFEDSCAVAAGTIRNILARRPPGSNPFSWLNTRYAEDPHWWKGVQALFNTLLEHSENTGLIS